MKRHAFHFLFVFGALSALFSALTLFALRPSEVSRKRIVFEGTRGNLVGDIYRLRGSNGNTPETRKLLGILVCHGVENNKEVTAHLAIEFARRGHVAMAFDYGGYGESTAHDDRFDVMVADTLAALSVLAKLPDVDGDKLAIVGHSMGVSYAVAAAEHVGDSIIAVVGLGNEATPPQVPPRNMLLAMGLYDAFHTLPNMLGAIRESAGNNDLEPYQIAGDIRKGNARALFVSPISDHGIEPLDPLIIAQTIKWIESSAGKGKLSDIDVRVRESYRAEARIFLIMTSCMTLVAILFLLYFMLCGTGGYQFVIRTPILAIAVCAVVGNLSSPAVALACADATLVILIAAGVAAHLANSSKRAGDREEASGAASRLLAFGTAFIGAAAVSLLAGLLIHGVPVALSRAEWAMAIPRFLFHILLLRPYEGWCMLRAYAFSSYSQGWMPEIWFGVMIIIEAIRPGAITWLSGRVARTLVAAFRLRGPYKLRASAKSWAALAAAAIALIIILAQRFREGWLSGEAIRQMAIIGMKFLVIPLIIFILIVNLPFFSRDGVKL